MFFKRKSFNSAKCKTMLRLATSRIKLLRNMRDVQLKKLKGELTNLLNTNQEPSAHLKVEHIYREQNTMEAYEIIELLCQQIADKLPIVEAQKQCPIDLREAVATVIYAAPRCSDIPELQKIRRYLSAKYGKEFTAVAAELKTDCGVNRAVIERLSLSRPSVEVKLNLMKEIAAEYKLAWNPTALKSQLLTPHEDLLDGPCQFVGASQMSLPVSSEEPAFSPSSQHNQMTVSVEARTTTALNFADERQFIPFVRPTVVVGSPLSGSQPSSQVVTPWGQDSSGHVSHVSSPTSHEYGGDENSHFTIERRQSFKNVVSAARKAAESAERAAAAARAAIVIAGETLDEIGSSTDNESDNDGNEATNSSHEPRRNPPFVEADEGRGLCMKENSLKYPMREGGPLGHSSSPTVLSVERYADNNNDEDENDDFWCGSDSVNLSTFLLDRHGKNQLCSQGLNSRSSSKDFGYLQDKTSSHKRRLEMSRAAPMFDFEEEDDLNNENADVAALPILGGPCVQAPPKLPGGKTPSLTKSTSFTHPKLPDCDELEAHFRTLKAMNTKK